MKAKLLLFFAIALIITANGVNAQALKATGGAGLYRPEIWWLNFSDLIGSNGLLAGESTTRTFVVGGVTVTVLLDQVSFSGTVSSGSTLASVRLVGYRPGSYAGDGLDELYNIGGTGTNNTLYNGLSTNVTGTGSGLTANFRIRTYATLAGQPMDLSLIFGTGEEDASAEYEQVTINGSPWKLLEKRQVSNTAHQDVRFSNNNLTARIRAGSGNIALLYTTYDNTTLSSPLTANVQVLCGGKTAIVLGLMISSDNGDNPASYGDAVNIFQPTLAGGDPSATSGTFTDYLSTNGTTGGTPVINAGTKTNPVEPRFGSNAADPDQTYIHSAAADADDNSGTDDEDAFPSGPPSSNLQGASYEVTIPVFKNSLTPSTPRYVSGWVDFNRDGVFSADEFAYTSFTLNNTATSVTLNWPLSSIPKNAGWSYSRFRISSDNPSLLTDNGLTLADERSFTAMTLGETEDYRIFLTSTPIISGNVFNDQNGLTDNLINGPGTNAGSIHAILVDALGNVAASTPVASNGQYSFSDIANGTYKILLYPQALATGTTAPTSALLPSGWVTVGEGPTSSGDGAPNSIITSVTIVDAAPVTNFNFGIERAPVAINDTVITIMNVPVSGMAAINDSCAEGPCTFSVVSNPLNGNIVLNSNGNFNYTPNIGFLGSDSLFYRICDSDGDCDTAMILIRVFVILPDKLTELSAQVGDNCMILLSWHTNSSQRADRFIVETGTDGNNFKFFASVKFVDNRQHYSLEQRTAAAGVNYFRIKTVQPDGVVKYSKIISVKSNCDTKKDVIVFPGITNGQVHVQGLSNGDAITIINRDGRTMLRATARSASEKLDLSAYAAGLYYVIVIRNNNERITSVVLRK